MKGTPAIYLGRIVNKENFRAVVYGIEGKKKLVNSWHEFESAMQSGLWFATIEDANESIEPMKNDKKRKNKSKNKNKTVKIEEIEELEDEIEEDEMVFEVKDGQ